MPVHTNKIELLDSGGSATETVLYQDIRGNFEYARNQVEVLRRKGVDGVGLRDIGSRGIEFTFSTVQYATSFGNATTVIQSAQSLIGSGAPYGVRIMQHSSNQGVYRVLGVRSVPPPRAVGAVAGSLIANPQVEVALQWRVIA